ncbi:hypothetical protein POM88_053556 [Heracleum sosnowskyi]|uniref:Uncharacterized protein n=1 Tax=Heracleum sosnowskyi TaxID=360622 RepID=A0AAD8LXK2_9APIA|nr:hypothetical protein POM88_053556 [Heracleum sosnowskyi]
MISETCPGALRIRDHNLVYVKGTLHWLAERKQGWIIVSLDMDTAKLREKLISHPCLEVTKFYLTRAHADFLAILRSRWNSSGYMQNGCTIEVYDENLTTVSIDLDDNRGENLFPLGFRNNGEAVLLKMPNADRMLSYDFATKQLKDLGFLDQNSSLESALPFVKSLVLINDGDVQTTTPPVLGKKFV